MLNVSTFPCPNCHEFISASVTTCRYCFVPINPQAASTAVELQDKVNSACNDASLVRNLAGAMWVFSFVRFYPHRRVCGARRDDPSFSSNPDKADHVAS